MANFENHDFQQFCPKIEKLPQKNGLQLLLFCFVPTPPLPKVYASHIETNLTVLSTVRFYHYPW